jgi:hypothetical protein
MHFVAQFWLRGFRASGGEIYIREGATVKAGSTRKIMGGEHLYTIFNTIWQPSDALEDSFTKIEAAAAAVFRQLGAGVPVTSDLRVPLVHFLALTICRHPDVMSRARRRGVEGGYLIADIHSYPDFPSFNRAFRAKFHADLPEEVYQLLKAKTEQQLLDEADELEKLSPQAPQLPIQDSVRAVPLVFAKIVAMDMTLLDAPAGRSFVLGDTPLPDYELGQGFSVPLSHVLALKMSPAGDPAAPLSLRRAATPEEVAEINRIQFENAKRLVIASEAAVLNAL